VHACVCLTRQFCILIHRQNRGAAFSMAELVAVRHKRPTGRVGSTWTCCSQSFLSKDCGFRARISCSQSFLLKDLWFRSSAFRPTEPSPSVEISCSQRPPLYPVGQCLRTVAKYSTARFCRELKSQSPVIPYSTTCLPAPPFRRRIFDG